MTKFAKIDDTYAELAELAAGQCTALMEKFEEINDPDDPSDDEPETLQGVTRTLPPLDRAALVFQSSSTPNQRAIVFVDAILDLAALILRERIIPYEPKRG